MSFLNRTSTLIAILVIGVLVFFVGEVIYQFKNLEAINNHQVTVVGEGKVYIKPDIALASLGVTTEGTTTKDVITRNTEKMNAVIKP